MALDALRSTFNFKKSSTPAGPIPGWGQPVASDAPAIADPDMATDALPFETTAPFPPPSASVPEPAPWDVQKTPWDTAAMSDETDDAPEALEPASYATNARPYGDPPTLAPAAPDWAAPAMPAAPEPYAPARPTSMTDATTFAIPTVDPGLLATAPQASGPSTYAADQYANVFADPIAGGDTGKEAFGCPKCGRTLDRGTFRCEDCGTFLILGQPLKLVAPFIAGGLVVGILVATLLLNLVAAPKVATVAGLDGATGGTGSGTGGAALDVPSGATAALRGTTAINGRLAAEATTLRKALAAKKFRAGDVQKVLRRMAIDARAGSGMLGTLAAWPEATGQQAALDAFYTDLQRQIDGGLKASVRSAGAYKKAAKAILGTLERTPDLDTDARTLAGQVGIELAPVTFPDSLR